MKSHKHARPIATLLSQFLSYTVSECNIRDDNPPALPPSQQSQCPHMVRLLHHYETSSQRLFLLLEHVKGGSLIDFVQAKRAQWLRLKEAAMNPPHSTLLKQRSATTAGDMDSNVNQSKTAHRKADDDLSKGGDNPVAPLSESQGGASETDEMERMLSELTSIIPPSDLPVTNSLGSNEGSDSDATNSLDNLAMMRQRLQETIEESSEEGEIALTREHSEAGVGPGDTEDEEAGTVGGGEERPASTAINIQPPTPTTVNQNTSLGIRTNSFPVDTGQSGPGGLQTKSSPSSSGSPQSGRMLSTTGDRRTSKPITPVESRGSSPGKASPRQGSPHFSPGSLQNSPELSSKVDDWVRRLEDNVRLWMAQIVLALECLHAHGVVCR